MPEAARDVIKRVAPLDASGMNLSRPSTQVVWTLLKNVVIHEGRIETRPGFKPLGPFQEVTTNPPGIPTVFAQAEGYDSQQAGSTGVTQRLVPTGTVSNATWAITGAATAHAALDETPPDDDTTNVLGTDADDLVLSFANLSPDLDIVDGLVIWVRARAGNIADLLTVTLRDDNDDTIATFTPTAGEFDDEGAGTTLYQDFFFAYDRRGATKGQSLPLRSTHINNFELGILVDNPDTAAFNFIEATAYGGDNDWSETVLANWYSSDQIPAQYNADDDQDSITLGEAGERVSFVYSTPDNTYNSLSSIRVRFTLARRDRRGTWVQLYHVGTDSVRRNLGVAQQVEGLSTTNTTGDTVNAWDLDAGAELISYIATTNPETSAAWTPAELAAGLEFGIQNVSGAPLELSSTEIFIRGKVDGSGVYITAAQLLATGRQTTGNDDSAEVLNRLMATSENFQHLIVDNDWLTGLNDVTASVTTPTAGPWDWDWTEYFNKIYIDNGIDDTYFFRKAAGTKEMDQLSTDLQAHTIWTFGNRLMKGDVIDAGTRHPKRVAWCGIAAPDTWDSSDAGDLDLTHGGIGRLRKGLPLSSHVSALYLDRGIYNLRWTGDASAPFVPRIVDSDTGIVAPNSCLAVQDGGGTSTHFFLGVGPQGIDVYAYDGVQAQPVGAEIRDEMRRLLNPSTYRHAFAAIEPRLHLYLLFVPEGTQVYPEQCWVYHLESGHFTRWTLPFAVTAAGQWKILRNQFDQDSDWRLVVGTLEGVPYVLDFDRYSDVELAGAGGDKRSYFDTGDSSSQGIPDYEVPINVDIQSGDFELSDDTSVRLTIVNKLWLTLLDHGRLDYEIQESLDGAVNWETAVDLTQGGNDDGAVKTAPIDIAPKSGRRHRIRIKSTSASTRQKLALSEYDIIYQDMGELP